MLSTMSDYPLTMGSILDHGVKVHGGSVIACWTGESLKRTTFQEAGARAKKFARALLRSGITPGDRVGTLCWNTPEHVEAYYAISGMGAVVHTLNLRLFPEQLAFIINHAADRMLLVDACLLPVLARIRSELRTVERVVVVGEAAEIPNEFLRYEDLLAGEEAEFEWPQMDERSAAAMCYTTGTTGEPKGVVYSHRSIYLHALAVCTPWVMGGTENDRILLIVPMFHANAWGIPYSAWMMGADLLMPAQYMQPEALCRMIGEFRPTMVAGVPTILSAMLQYALAHKVDLSFFRQVCSGGAAMPRSLAEGFQKSYGVKVVQGWGLTETSPVAALARAPKGSPTSEEIEWTTKTGRVIPGVELRICEDETVLPWDGESIGEIEVRGPWVTSSYYGVDAPERFHDGWLRTGDMGTVDPRGFIQITDRAKDVIKSGGEWISSVELENAITDHEDVLEAAVIGIPDERWDERPLASVVPKEGSAVDIAKIRVWLAGRVAKWWIPERWTFIKEVPKTSVGKYDKKELRRLFAGGELVVITFAANLESESIVGR